MDDSYLTIARPVTIETKVKGSRFIGESMPVDSIGRAQQFVDDIRKREHSATHHCFAYRLGLEPNVEFKYSDDGEPSGTAGKPIYDCIIGKKLTNTLVVVTRYFGGTKLGTGGLARAYSNAAKESLGKAKIKTVYLTDELTLTFDFRYYDSIQRLLNKFGAGQHSSDFSQHVKLVISIRKSLNGQLKQELTNLTGGKIEIENES